MTTATTPPSRRRPKQARAAAAAAAVVVVVAASSATSTSAFSHTTSIVRPSPPGPATDAIRRRRGGGRRWGGVRGGTTTTMTTTTTAAATTTMTTTWRRGKWAAGLAGPSSLASAASGDGEDNFDYSSYAGAMMMTDESPSSFSSSSSSSSVPPSSSWLGDASSSSSSHSSMSSSSSSAADAAPSSHFDLDEQHSRDDGTFDDNSPAASAAAAAAEEVGGERGDADAISRALPPPAAVAGAATATEADAAASSAEEDARSRFEEDLELTRSVILRHIERMAADDDDDDDEGNDRIIVDGDDDDDNEDEHNIEMRDFDKLRKTPLRDYYDDNATGGRSRVGSTKTTAMRGGGGEEEDDDDSIIDVAVVDVENDVERKIAEGQSSSSSSSSSTSSSTDDADASANAVAAPTIPRILRYTLPAIGIWLCSPVLSMIDTAAVGMLAGTAQQAALNPAISVSDYGALVVAFMYTATTNLVAAAAREDRDDAAAASAAASSSASTTTATGGARTTTKTTTTNDDAGVRRSTPHRPRTTRTLVTALRLATGVGTFFAIALFALGPRLLKLLIGNDASHLDPVVFDSALRYVRIRALGMPAMVTIGTAQSACLGMQDVRSPLYVLLAAAIVNFLGDVALVPLSGGWRGDFFGGAAGAAWATVASQYAALLFFARWWLTEPPGAAIGDNCDAAAPANAAAGWKANLRLFLKKKDGGGEGDGAGTTETSATSSGGGGGGHLETDGLLPAAMTIVTTTTATGALASDNANENRIIRWISNDRRKRRHHHRDPTAPSPTETMAQRRRRGPGKNTTTATTTRGFLSDSGLTLRSYLSPKNLDASKAWEFLPFVVPVTTTSVGRISGYIAMSHVASSTLGTIDMAGHQIILSIFSCITPFVDALSQVAQSLVPEVYAANGEGKRRNGRRERSIALGRTVQNFRKVGAGLGAVLVGLVSCIPLISRYFTTDAYVLASVHGAIPPVGLFMLVNGLMCAGEGTLLGQKDLKFLRNMYVVFFFTVPAYMLRLKHRSLTGVQIVGIETMWTAFAMYNVIRSSSFHLRLAQLQRRTERGAEVALDDVEPRE